VSFIYINILIKKKKNFGINSLIFINSIRTKVDLTKYVEQHTFVFDDVFDAEADNEEVK
jgi:kinesin family protein 2/24